jgi:tRNA 5-methylaminomethyl-2-thiouridine biosynthesis bifunctional protein
MGGLGNATSLENLTPKGLSNDTMKSPDSLFCMGASYERDMKQVVNSASVRESNVRKLSELMPQLKLSSSAQLMDWSGTRSTCQDRLPLVGPVSSELEGLWVMSALGSRGLSMSVMLAEHLSSLMTLEPSPLPKRLSQAIDPKRFLP